MYFDQAGGGLSLPRIRFQSADALQARPVSAIAFKNSICIA